MNTLDSGASSDNPAACPYRNEADKPYRKAQNLVTGRGDLAPVSSLSGNLRQVRNTSEGSRLRGGTTCCGFENRHEESPPAQSFCSVGARVASRWGSAVAREPILGLINRGTSGGRVYLSGRVLRVVLGNKSR